MPIYLYACFTAITKAIEFWFIFRKRNCKFDSREWWRWRCWDVSWSSLMQQTEMFWLPILSYLCRFQKTSPNLVISAVCTFYARERTKEPFSRMKSLRNIIETLNLWGIKIVFDFISKSGSLPSLYKNSIHLSKFFRFSFEWWRIRCCPHLRMKPKNWVKLKWKNKYCLSFDFHWFSSQSENNTDKRCGRQKSIFIFHFFSCWGIAITCLADESKLRSSFS